MGHVFLRLLTGRKTGGLLATLVATVFFACACGDDSTCPTAPTGRTVFYGNLSVDSQTGVDALAGIQTWIGDLRIGSSNIDNLRGLGSLRRVDGQLDLFVPNVDSFAPLSSLVEVERLMISDGGRVTSLAPLSRIEGCVSVYISGCDSLDRLPTGELFADARTISISDLPRLSSLEPLAVASAVTYLRLRHLPAIDGFEALASLPLLEDLHLSGFDGVSIPDLTGLPVLRQLDIDSWPDLTSLASLSGYVALERLTLRSCESLTSLDGLAGCSGLSSIYLSNCDGLGDLDGIRDLPALDGLDISGCDDLTSLAGLGLLPNLHELEVRYCNEFASLEGSEALPGLEGLWLSELRAMTDFSGLSSSISLSDVNIRGCDTMVSLTGLRLARGADLLIERCNSLGDCQGIAMPDSLGDLRLDFMKLDDMRGFEPVTHISFLQLSYGAMTTLDGLQGLRYLRSGMSIENNDFLVDASGLAGIDSIGVAGVEIRDNPRLDNCIVQIMSGAWNVEGSVVIKDNGPCAR